MPTLSMFYGIIISMYYDDHNPPHIHAHYQDDEAVFDFDGNIIKGSFPRKQRRLVEAWLEIHQDELIANWKLAKTNQTIYKIEPLR